MNKREQTKQFFNNLAPKWDSMIKRDEDKIETLFKLIKINEDDKVLDIGTGTGVLIPDLSKRNPRELIGMDISEEMIKIAESKEENKNAKFLVQDFLDYEETGFNLIVCYQVYPHFNDKAEFIKNLFNCLIPGGRFVIFHPDSKEVINNRHSGKEVSKLSDNLQDAYDEANRFAKYFKIDMIIDTDDMYMISGTKKALPE